MRLSNIVAGISLLRPYYTDPDGYHIGADHDIVYMYATDRPLPAEDVARMVELGWHQLDSEESEDGELLVYDPENSWGAYV